MGPGERLGRVGREEIEFEDQVGGGGEGDLDWGEEGEGGF